MRGEFFMSSGALPTAKTLTISIRYEGEASDFMPNLDDPEQFTELGSEMANYFRASPGSVAAIQRIEGPVPILQVTISGH